MQPQPKTLFDVSVLIDALTNDEHPAPESSAALTLAANGHITGYVCASTIESLHDHLTRTHGHLGANAKLNELRAMLEIAPVDAEVIDAAMGLGWRYFDDALLHECARVNGLDHVVSLNAPDFDEATLPVLAPGELLRQVRSAAA
ncbi:PIN domain-containing protein [Allochromatium humboldtianum]|jgi:predicted nucleic acid-binding protein|uniref:PIN domain-containing protein n=1 Tax=Allochromatium humboldtianum TaxID=504901 RepID=A0A850RP18_9GAMM|nr:PIN domain-containing protein [Allochromatium humboldtianum]NVZ11201.1 PIN domain-containing protein [Allochromatium humboldtianum]